MGVPLICAIFLGAFLLQLHIGACGNPFDTYYIPLWGNDHFIVNPEGSEVQLKFDQTIGGAGFRSKADYGSGWFHIQMMLPSAKTGGIVPNFYLTSQPDNKPPETHFEIDFEFLGTNGSLQTNVYDNDGGHREQTFRLWFDPSQGFHSYDILWNSHQIAFFIDKIPVRVFKNNVAHGISYPSKPLHIEASIWDADWAGNVDWSKAPFISSYQDFDFGGCQASGDDILQCSSPIYFWNKPENWELNLAQKSQMDYYRKNYMTYDYCSSPATRKPECSFN